VNVLAKFEALALPFPEKIGGTQKIWAVPALPGYAHAPFSPKSLMGFCSDGPCKFTAKFAVRIALPVPEITATAVLGWGCEPPILGKGRP